MSSDLHHDLLFPGGWYLLVRHAGLCMVPNLHCLGWFHSQGKGPRLYPTRSTPLSHSLLSYYKLVLSPCTHHRVPRSFGGKKSVYFLPIAINKLSGEQDILKLFANFNIFSLLSVCWQFFNLKSADTALVQATN